MQALKFDDHFVSSLPGDVETENFPRQVYKACYSWVTPKLTAQPKLIAYSSEVAQSLDLSVEDCQSDLFAQVFSGNQLLPGMRPYANCYGGHQFGNWAGQLGDGRAINLGELINSKKQRLALQLKEAGPTPYSRTADGLAVLRSSLREFLCSEAMHHLGVPTTRALSLTLSGDLVTRDMFYDGNVKDELGAVVCRVAPSFTRFGSFELFSARDDLDTLQQLVDYTILTDFPHLCPDAKQATLEHYLQWFQEICDSTASLIVHWMRVGFVHGVMNTDNMSILGLTIDYGPYGWLEDYDPNWTPNTTDARGRRYRFDNQAKIAQWNLYKLANALLPAFAAKGLEGTQALETILQSFEPNYQQQWQQMMANKLGITELDSQQDSALFEQLLATLPLSEVDMTLFFRQLANIDTDSTCTDEALFDTVATAYYGEVSLEENQQMLTWLRSYTDRLSQQSTSQTQRRQLMNTTNPLYVLRNYLAQLAIDKAEQGNYSQLEQQLEVLRKPYEEQAGMQQFAEKRPDWARNRAGCSMLSCSS
ncbi:MAG: hypothetical protein COC19_04850 [SAR86 cluster bacterium]|uniref:Protein nucleotidyltransferase YdiU n=1 Tax=SAR86 cluster bacterium TaxID=2030880 RepID=A0A2A4MP41_9GAMM|nr:MAG: hypothetical protein COC19_04850 [SAR86 cluster bacterium]